MLTSNFEYSMAVKVGDIVYYEEKNQIKDSKIVEILGKMHSFGKGYGLVVKLADGKEISSLDLFDSPEPILEYKATLKDFDFDFDKVELPKINK